MSNARAKSVEIKEYEFIFLRYLEICNSAIIKNKDIFPYKEIWKAHRSIRSIGNSLQCAVYDDRPKIVYSLNLNNTMKISIVNKTPSLVSDAWPFKYSYLKSVVDDPNNFIEHPANLDWTWLAEFSA